MMITAAQVYYITRVYPERITQAEALEVYECDIKTEEDITYWEAAADKINELTT